MSGDLVTWLHTQLDEDEQARMPESQWFLEGPFDPDFVRAETAVRRRILDLHVISARKTDRPPFDPYTGQPQPDEYEVECAVCGWAGDDPTAGCITLRLLALPYADSPGYQEAWRP